MFDNIGRKIKSWAKTVCYFGIGASFIFGSVLIDTYKISDIISGLLVMVLGFLISWVGSFCLYGFGELIEKTTEIAENTRCSNTANETISKNHDDITK